MGVDHERLTELFAEVMDLEPGPLRARLAELRASDPALADELASLLDEDARVVTALRTAGLKPSDLGSGIVQLAPLEFGFAIANYHLLEKLGEGGMGFVYAADQIDPPRPVAIKILHAASQEARTRFRAEAGIMSSLDHPGIVRVLGTGEANGHPFFVMDRVDGLTLDDHVRTHAPPMRDRLELIAAVCDAVHYAHSRGVIHRDLKPANIMVRSDGTVAVLDFGVARATMFSGATRPGDYLGTPLYMSPEQAMARPDEVDARTDVYSLGVTLFELIANRPPFDLIGLSFPASIRTILQQPPPPLGNNAELDAIVARTLAKKPADRYPSTAALAADLRRYLSGG